MMKHKIQMRKTGPSKRNYMKSQSLLLNFYKRTKLTYHQMIVNGSLIALKRQPLMINNKAKHISLPSSEKECLLKFPIELLI